MRKIHFGLIGSGWRAEFYIRIAKALPDLFELTGVLIREKEKGESFAAKFNVNVVNTLEELKTTKPEYVVLSVKRGIVSEYLPVLFEQGIPVLCETPVGEDLESLENVWNEYKKHNAKVQVAEQYITQPLYESWAKVIEDKMLGEVQNISISALHGYHGISIIRHFLGIEFQNCIMVGKKFWFDITETYGREGMIFDGEISSCSRDRITIEFEDGKVAFFDFSDPAQYHSFIRTRQINVQGTRGEIDDLTIRYLSKEKNIPVTQELFRKDLGIYNNQEWTHLGIMLGEEFLYKNPFVYARLNDDEIAVASCMYKMKEYLESGKEFYGLKDALQDMYLSIKMDAALNNENQEVITETMIWAK